MSAADEAWQEWHKDASNDGFVRRCQRAAFLAGYRRALEDAADAVVNESEVSWGDGPGGYYGAMVDHTPLDAWLYNRAAAVVPRETKDDR